MDLNNLGKKETPGGIHIQDGDEFSELKKEIQRIKAKDINWAFVSERAAYILEHLSKDLFAACYLGVAQIYLKDLEGFETGLTIIYDLITIHWDNCHPPPNRIKGRHNAIKYFINHSTIAFKRKKYQNIDKCIIDNIQKKLEQLENILRDTPNLLPSFKDLYETIKQISVIETISSKHVDDSKQQSKNIVNTNEATEDILKKPENIIKPTDNSEDEKEIKDYNGLIDAILKKIVKPLPAVFTDDNCLCISHLYRLNRYRWLTIQNAPDCPSGTKTGIEEPNSVYKEAIKMIENKRQWFSLIRESEKILQSSPFWLDLNYYTAKALKQLGNDYQDALIAVQQETVTFVKRIPEIVNLQFNTGTEFASMQTKEWLQNIQQPQKDELVQSTTLSSVSENNSIENEINQITSKQSFEEAIATIQNKMTLCESRSDLFEYRFALANFFINNNRSKAALPHFEIMLDDIDHFRLIEWNPKQALKALSSIWRVFNQQQVKISPETINHVFKRISQIDPLIALKLFEKKY